MFSRWAYGGEVERAKVVRQGVVSLLRAIEELCSASRYCCQ